jgi:mono/diheme cytochrome c family protein
MRRHYLSTRSSIIAIAAAILVVVPWTWSAETADNSKSKPTSAHAARGRYLVAVGNCNDCHTSNFAERDGNVPESTWLQGSPVGFKGPWGTTYAPNLRITVSGMTEAQWVTFAKTLKTRPPMPWFNLNLWSDGDLRALYQYIKSLGPVGSPAPGFMPPDKQPAHPYIAWPSPPK